MPIWAEWRLRRPPGLYVANATKLAKQAMFVGVVLDALSSQRSAADFCIRCGLPGPVQVFESTCSLSPCKSGSKKNAIPRVNAEQDQDDDVKPG